MTRVILAALIALSGAFTPVNAAQPSRSPEIWLFLRGSESAPKNVDWKEGWDRLSDRDAELTRTLRQVQVMAISHNVPDDLLAKAITILKRKHIRLAMEVLAQSWVNQPLCGKGVESYTDPPGNAKIAARIKAAGGTLAYITMDEPLWFGHYYSGPNACRSPIDNVADRAAAIVAEYRKVFPAVVVGDTEPFPALTKQADWQEVYRAWLGAFHRATGEEIAFINMDINWPEDNGHWTDSVKAAVNFFHGERLPFGIIYNASIPGSSFSEQQWLDSAADNIILIEERLGIHPEKALFESWDKFPTHTFSSRNMLGEDYLVEAYLRTRRR
jgi:hypothetical protein